MRIFKPVILLGSVILVFSCYQAEPNSVDTLLRVEDSISGESGYINQQGDTVVPLGKYQQCFTDSFSKLALVAREGKGIVGIDREENILFEVYPFDNGPDYPSDGLFRIIENGKIGFANLEGEIIIPPKYDCAYPFKDGHSRVGFNCSVDSSSEHRSWTGGEWQTINKKGEQIAEE